MKKGLHKYKMIVALLCAVCFCFSLTACSERSGNNGAKGSAGFVDFNAIEEEYLATLKELNWPEGYSLPTKLEGQEEVSFQTGWGVVKASMLWECAWMKEWLKSYRTDAKRADAAIKELEKAFEMPYMNPSACDDAARRSLRAVIDRAKLGDPTGFEKDTRQNCSK